MDEGADDRSGLCFRKWERRFALDRASIGIKAVYATLIGVGTSSAYTPDAMTAVPRGRGVERLARAGLSADSALRAMHCVGWLDRRYTLLTVPRYTPYRDALLALSQHANQVRIAEISGNRIVTFTGTAPRGWSMPGRTIEVTAYETPADRERVRAVLATDARDLLDVLGEAQRTGLVVDHIYDY